jgi:hypothetical protein
MKQSNEMNDKSLLVTPRKKREKKNDTLCNELKLENNLNSKEKSLIATVD